MKTLPFTRIAAFASMLSAQGGKPAAGLGAQAYALRTTTVPDMSYWVLGGDASGAMYGGLQLAENIPFHDLGGVGEPAWRAQQ